ncbi:MAG TPA: TIGR02281 family clan AA aspartic protease [Alphaproteobacteria bacterium]|nr:TIGR02281 family clan AA aspartic protease [Alphaproteobacteria bacterium]
MRPTWIWFALLMGGTILLVLFLENRFPGTLSDSDNRMSILYKVGWIALLASSLIGGWRLQPKTALRNAAIWAAIFLVLIGIFSFRQDAATIGDRILGELSPTQGTVEDDGTIHFSAGPDGHFRIQAIVNGARVTFLVDTGATDVVLAPDDARRIGCDMANLKFTQFAETANGTVRGAPVTLQSLIIGPIDITGMSATVNSAEMSDSLLGMAFLNRLSGWRVENGVLTLEP